MSLADLKRRKGEENFILNWLESINETDLEQIKEVLELMKKQTGYREWIVNYAKLQNMPEF